MTIHSANGNRKPPAPAKPTTRRSLILAGCWLLLGLLGWLDDRTGYELSFFVFYAAPVGLGAWYGGRWPAIGLALGSTVAWLLADYYTGLKYSTWFYYYWNGAIHFLAFIINAVTIAKIKKDLDQRHALAAELKSAWETLRAVEALLPACPGCGRPRPGAGNRGQTELVTLAREHPELAGVLCADCMANAVNAAAGSSVTPSSPSVL